MVPGKKALTRNPKSPSVQIDYLIHIQDIRPWPPSPLLRSLRSVLIHWENGGRHSGSTRSVSPSLSSVQNDGKIEFNEFFQLPVTLQRDMSVIRTGNSILFQKNLLVFNLYEPRRDNILKGQLIGTAMIDLADYGIMDEPLSVIASLNCKRSFRNMVQPFLHIRIQPIEKGRAARSSSCGSSPSIELSVGESGGKSISASFDDEYAEEAEITTLIEDDLIDEKHSVAGRTGMLSTDNSEEQGFLGNDTFSFRWDGFGSNINPPHVDKKSVESLSDTATSNRLGSHGPPMGERQVSGTKNCRFNERREARVYAKDRKGTTMSAKVQKLERRIQELEGELSEATALEVSLYTVSAEHGSSSSKVHAPARRLFELYYNACTELSQSSRASTSRSALSGLVLVAKACGNDVPRLTYWLSNCAVLRATLSRTIVKDSFMIHPSSRKQCSPSEEAKENCAEFHSLEQLHAFIGGLEKIEAWIFSRVVESIWWQILIPHMHSIARKTSERGKDSRGSNKNGRKLENRTKDQIHADLSFEHWKKAFAEVLGRLCPARAGGRTCGCLLVLARLIMEQCTTRLDAAMFNAILRESSDDISIDPESDPITDIEVLPIPAGKLSFKVGAQLKHVIGNWSRWLADHFGTDDEDLTEVAAGIGRHGSREQSFHLLNALSDLTMLPKDLLLSASARKEVCPALGAPLIKRVLENFVPDEFCPNPVPQTVLNALAAEEYPCEANEDSVTSYPCVVAAPVYSPPSAASVSGILNYDFLSKEQNNGDEVDKMTLPLASVLFNGSISLPTSTIPSSVLKENAAGSRLRYKLFRDIWMDGK